MTTADFPRCPICDHDDWTVVHSGAVRDGGFGKNRLGRVARCGGCGVERLAESLCLPDHAYQTAAYRDHLDQGHDLARHYAGHDEFARFTLETLWPNSLRGKIVADIGCGGGSLLDHLRGLPDELLAIDPDRGFAASLQDRGYRWIPSAREAAATHGGRIDVAFSIQVIEHVADPRGFLAEIRPLLSPDGVLIVSTPNRADILMELLPGDFPGFFYRTQHRWCFDAASLARCAGAAGFAVTQTRHVHRYGMANALLWLRDRRPKGRNALPPIDRAMDGLWTSWLEATGRADCLYQILRPMAPRS